MGEIGAPVFAVSLLSHLLTSSNNANSVPIRTYPYSTSAFLPVAGKRASARCRHFPVAGGKSLIRKRVTVALLPFSV